jgi:hypothetical protein
VFTLSALCLVTSSQAQNVIAGPIVNPNNNHTYYLLDTASWTGSESDALLLGGHLVTINDVGENDWVFDTFVPLQPTNAFGATLWIGLNDAAQEGTFVWSSGEPVTFTNWDPAQPDNARGEEDYAHVWTPFNMPQDPTNWRKWNDAAEDGFGIGTPFGVVEVISVSQVPEPSSWTLFGLGVLVVWASSRYQRRKTM